MALIWLDSDASWDFFSYASVAAKMGFSRQNVWARMPGIMRRLGVSFKDREDMIYECYARKDELIPYLRIMQQRLKPLRRKRG